MDGTGGGLHARNRDRDYTLCDDRMATASRGRSASVSQRRLAPGHSRSGRSRTMLPSLAKARAEPPSRNDLAIEMEANEAEAVPLTEVVPVTSEPSLTVHSFGLTDRGRVRQTNEDQFVNAKLSRAIRIEQSS